MANKTPLYAIAVMLLCMLAGLTAPGYAQDQRPNILIVISDDHSFPHASAYGSGFVETPAFDRVAGEGVLFMNGWAPSPGCSPSRAAMLTGRYPWQIEQAGTHASSFPEKYVVLPDLLEKAGYWVGFTGKGWGPGDWEVSGRDRNPAGPAFQQVRLESPHRYVRNTDYSGNFKTFLEQRPENSPFYFWLGTSEPHRAYEKGIGLKAGKRLEDAEVPAYLPDSPEVRSDLLDYAVEVEWFDNHLGQAVRMLEDIGELDNTLIIVTADQGMPFPRAKANLYNDGLHVPLAIRWGDKAASGRVVDDLVNLIDFMPTILEVAGVEHPGTYPMAGRSLLNILTTAGEGLVDPSRDAAYSGRERHSDSRWYNLGYPQRAIRTHRYLYIRNFAPERWPAGTPRRIDDGELTPMHVGYHDIDAAPSLDVMTENAEDPYFSKFLHLSVGKRPAEELYDIQKDPASINNLALDPDYEHVTGELRSRLMNFLEESGDPRVTGDGNIWERYPRLRGPLREFPPPEWALPVQENTDR
ncbi:MAG: sulfatase [Balneolales bacterium]